VVYVGVVVGIGALLGGEGGRPDLALSIGATAVVALAFGAVRERVQLFANRLVYGRRATPYQALSAFASRMGTAVAAEDLLPAMARALAEGTGASEAAVWLLAGDELRPEARFPDGSELPPSIRIQGDRPAVPGADLTLPVGDHGELLGALSLTKPRGERLTPLEHTLAADLAPQAGLVLRNVRLNEELLARMREVRGSRQRIVSAQDAERRRLERNIHDGAQQELVALAVRLRLAKAMLERDPPRAVGLLDDLADAATNAAGTLRELASGIYPSKLAEGGLVGALRDQAARAALPTVVDAARIGRYPPTQEAAVYFSVLEALQNVAKYAGASRATVSLAQENGSLAFEVADDGRGFDASTTVYGTGLQGIADRVAAIGGELQVRSAPGEGTTVVGRVPAVAISEPIIPTSGELITP
jgi:signal transduction histidine kinase